VLGTLSFQRTVIANFRVFVAREIVKCKAFVTVSTKVNFCGIPHVFFRISSHKFVGIVEVLLDLSSNLKFCLYSGLGYMWLVCRFQRVLGLAVEWRDVGELINKLFFGTRFLFLFITFSCLVEDSDASLV
jgi:hypothetical protein